MKLKNVKVGETYIIKSLEHTNVGDLPYKIGDKVVVRGLRPTYHNTVSVQYPWSIHHKDLKQIPIEYPHPMMEHLGKEVYVASISNRGFVVSYSNIVEDDDLLVDFGIGFGGHCGGGAVHPQKNRTNLWVNLEDITFLTEDEE